MKPRTFHPRDLGATRFFARVLAFLIECPACGHVAAVRGKGGLPGIPQARFDPLSARFQCSSCDRTYTIGLLAWPVQRGAGAQAPPDDQIPGPRQLAQMRQEGDGFWLPDDLRSAGRLETSNLAGGPRPEPEDALDVELAIRPPVIDGRPGKPWIPPLDDGDDDR